MNSIKTLTLSMIALCALFSGAAFANPPEEAQAPTQAQTFREKMDAKHQELYKELNLTEEQKKALEENKNKNRENRKAQFERTRVNMDKMGEELQKDPLDMPKIEQIQADLKESQAQMIDSRLQGILEVRKILTPEQFKKFLAKKEELKGKWKHQGKGWDGEHKKDFDGPPEEMGQ